MIPPCHCHLSVLFPQYVLIKVSDKTSEQSKFVVRGYADCEYHGMYLFISCAISCQLRSVLKDFPQTI